MILNNTSNKWKLMTINLIYLVLVIAFVLFMQYVYQNY